MLLTIVQIGQMSRDRIPRRNSTPEDSSSSREKMDQCLAPKTILENSAMESFDCQGIEFLNESSRISNYNLSQLCNAFEVS